VPPATIDLADHPTVAAAVARGLPRTVRRPVVTGPAAADRASVGLLVVPLLAGVERVGAIVLEASGRGAFRATDLRFARDLATLAGPALRAAELRGETDRRAAAQTAVLVASQAATVTNDAGEALRALARVCLEAGLAERCVIVLQRTDADELAVGAVESVAAWPGPNETDATPALVDCPNLQAILTDRTPLVVRPDDPTLTEGERQLCAVRDAASALVVPLAIPAGCLGVIALSRRGAEPFSPDETQLAREVAAQAALAIHNLQLREEVGRQAQEQALLLRVSHAATSSLASGEVLKEVARASLGIAGAESCGVELWRPETDEMEVVAEVTAPDWPGVAEAGVRYPLASWPALREVLNGNQPVAFAGDDPLLVNPEHGPLLADDVRSVLMVPMLAGRESLGLLCLYSRRPRAFEPRGVRLAQELAAQAALAAQNARLLEGARRRAEEQAALLRVGHVVNSGGDLAAILPQVTREILGASGVEGATIEVWDPAAKETRVLARSFLPGWATHDVLGARFAVADRPAFRTVVESHEPLILAGDSPLLTETERDALAVDDLQSVLLVPVLFGTDCRGAVTLASRRPGIFTMNTLWFAQDLAAQVAQAMEQARLHAALREQAETDGLTGLLNHRAVMEALDREVAAARRRDSTAGVLVIDLDDFKLFNDTHGHLVGDRVLRDVAALLRSCVREIDSVGRYGGDEFLVVLPDADPPGAARVADRILARAALRTLPIGDLRLPLRLSVGLATYPFDGESRQELIARADAAMYAAKDAGGGKLGTASHGTSSLQLTAYGALTGLVKAVDRKDRYTKEHSDQVARLAIALSRQLDLPPDQMEAVHVAAQLHDVGKIAVPDAILRKPGHLSLEEEAILRQHVTFGELIVQGVPHLPLVRAAIAAHHERWDGSGYPRGLVGESIPFLGRILALADAWAAMTADRPYRKGLPPRRAAAEVRAGAARQFDPGLVEPFLRALVALEILPILPEYPVLDRTATPDRNASRASSLVRTTTDRLVTP
jgi:diguanylate cyclase (GGDEF)-like protein